MQLTRAADYAIRVMVYLAGLPSGTRTPRSDLAAAADCPEQFLSKVLQYLTRAGLVTSHRGNTGGFELPDAHRQASVFEIVEAVEGPIHLNVCTGGDHLCSRQEWCPVQPVWKEAQEKMLDVLRSARIHELAKTLPPRLHSDLTEIN